MTAVVTATHRRSVVTDADADADLLHLSTTGVLRRRLLESHLWPTVAPATRSCFIAMLRAVTATGRGAVVPRGSSGHGSTRDAVTGP